MNLVYSIAIAIRGSKGRDAEPARLL
jgi:hypothetical protein